MKLRLATSADLPAIAALEAQTESAAHWTREQWARAFDPTAPARIVILVDEPESTALAGFLVALCAGPEWEIENVAVAAAARQRGYATLLVKELISRADASGAESVFLEVRESNEAAQALYGKCGFVCTGRRCGYYADPVEDALLYQLRLRQ